MSPRVSNKKVVQDIVPSEKRSIRNIPIEHSSVSSSRRSTTHSKVSRSTREEPEEMEEEIEMAQKEKQRPTKKRGASKTFISFVVIFICISVIAIAVSMFFSKAKVTVFPKIVPVSINGTLTAKKDAEGDTLGYKTITSNAERSFVLPAEKGDEVEIKAKGVITVYNNYSNTPQTLIAGTRFSNPEGLVYRTTNSILVPGKKDTAGTIDVTVVADEAGKSYNFTKSDDYFRIVAYKGTDKYADLYAHPKTNIEGGFIGSEMVVDESVKKETINNLKNELKAELITKTKSLVSDKNVLYDDSYSFEYTVSEPTTKTEDSAEIKVKATAYGIMFDKENLIKAMAGQEIQKFPSSTYNIKGLTDLDFKISNIKDFSIKEGSPVIFNLNGDISIVGTFPEDKLKKELRGLSLKDASTVFSEYSSIKNAHTLLTPFWLRSFPDSVENITIEYKEM